MHRADYHKNCDHLVNYENENVNGVPFLSFLVLSSNNTAIISYNFNQNVKLKISQNPFKVHLED